MSIPYAGARVVQKKGSPLRLPHIPRHLSYAARLRLFDGVECTSYILARGLTKIEYFGRRTIEKVFGQVKNIRKALHGLT